MEHYRTAMCSDSRTQWYYVEVFECESGEKVFTGPTRPTAVTARNAAFDRLALMFRALRRELAA